MKAHDSGHWREHAKVFQLVSYKVHEWGHMRVRLWECGLAGKKASVLENVMVSQKDSVLESEMAYTSVWCAFLQSH
jgi:hypothetical protein